MQKQISSIHPSRWKDQQSGAENPRKSKMWTRLSRCKKLSSCCNFNILSRSSSYLDLPIPYSSIQICFKRQLKCGKKAKIGWIFKKSIHVLAIPKKTKNPGHSILLFPYSLMGFILDFPISEKKCLNIAWEMIIKFLWESAYISTHLTLDSNGSAKANKNQVTFGWIIIIVKVKFFQKFKRLISTLEDSKLVSFYIFTPSFNLCKLISSMEGEKIPLLKQGPLLAWYSRCWNKVQEC